MYVSNGNKKVKACIFNLPTIVTCNKNLLCHKFCYAKKAEYLYPQVLPCRTNNLKVSKNDNFVTKMVSLLSKRKLNIVRIHESGDFYSTKYFEKWLEIARLLPNKTFYAYTKQYENVESSKIVKPSNFILIKSIDGIDCSSNEKLHSVYNKVALVSSRKTNCKAILNKKVTCMVDCTLCINKRVKKIIFLKH